MEPRVRARLAVGAAGEALAQHPHERGGPIAVYDSNQSWGKPDRGIQLFGSAREVEGAAIRHAETLYEKRFPDYRQFDLSPYRLYRFRPRRLKLFDEQALGTGVFVTAKLAGRGRLTWERTEVYRSGGDI